jgi:branched-chain amino acid transport system substrate-binding protein
MPQEAKEYAESKGMQVVSLQQVSQTVSDISGPMLQIQKSDPQLFMVMTNSETLEALAVSTAHTIGFSPDWYWSVGATNAQTTTALGGTKNVETLMGPTQFQATPKLKGTYFASEDWVSQYTKKYGQVDSFAVPMAFATGIVLGDAIEKAGSTDTEAVRKALLATTFDTFVGPITFTKPGDKSGLTGASLSRSMPTLQWQNGKLVVVAPSDIADAPLVKFKSSN